MVRDTSIIEHQCPWIHRVPKDTKSNIDYRRFVLENCAESDDCKAVVWNRCKRDPLYWLNVFGWTYDPRLENPEIPFITYEFQDVAVSRMSAAIGKRDVLIEKSRDMGASWLGLSVFTHRWLFYPYQSFLMLSRKEEYVDKTGDLKALFQKVDFLINHLPGWMVPGLERNKMHLGNLNNGSTIDGESTNKDAGRGDRRTAIFKDEFASVENDYEVESATRDATRCRFYNSTPKGTSNAFYERRAKMELENDPNLIRLHWSEHPIKAEGLYTSIGNELVIKDAQYKFPENYRFILDGKLRSPWYDDQCMRATSDQEIAQELDIDYKKSGWQFFKQDVIEEVVKRDCMKPFHEIEIGLDERSKPMIISDEGRLKLWTTLDIDGRVPNDTGYVVGCDIATGNGGAYGSNSVASIVSKFERRKVAEFKTNELPPDQFADYVLAICYMFRDGNDRPALLGWEDNGPGGQFRKRVIDKKYSNIFYRKNESSTANSKATQPGWWSTKETKRTLLGAYGVALKAGTFTNHSAEALLECTEYIHEPNGTISHSKSKSKVDPTASGENHGDIVIADALANRLLDEHVVMKFDQSSREPPAGSFGARLNEYRKRMKKSEDQWVE